METKQIQIIIQRVYIVNENGKKHYKSEKPLMAVSNKDEAIEQVKQWNDEEKEQNKRYKGIYHLEFKYELREVTLW